MVNTSSRVSAFLAYLLLVFGWLYVFLFRRNDQFAVFHAKQSIAAVAVAGIVFAAWAVVAWLTAWLPLGMVLGGALFALVILTFIVVIIAWIYGLIYALQGKSSLIPIVGGIANRYMSL